MKLEDREPRRERNEGGKGRFRDSDRGRKEKDDDDDDQAAEHKLPIRKPKGRTASDADRI